MDIKLLRVKEASGEAISSPDIVAEIMKEEAQIDRECFWVLHLNSSNKIIEKELVSMGVVDSSLVHPREVFKKAIINSAKCIITVHNHPGDKAEPSPQDLEIWETLNKSGKLLGIKVLENIIITPSGSYYSDACSIERGSNYGNLG